MKYENIERVKEIFNAIDEIDNVLRKLIYNSSVVSLLKADGTSAAKIEDSDTLIAIGQALEIRKEELIKELESL